MDRILIRSSNVTVQFLSYIFPRHFYGTFNFKIKIDVPDKVSPSLSQLSRDDAMDHHERTFMDKSDTRN